MREKISQEPHEQHRNIHHILTLDKIYTIEKQYRVSSEGGFLRLMGGRRGSPLKQAAWGGFVYLPQSLHGQDLDHINDHTRNLQRGENTQAAVTPSGHKLKLGRWSVFFLPHS